MLLCWMREVEPIVAAWGVVAVDGKAGACALFPELCKKVACECRPSFLVAGFDEGFYFFFCWHYAEGAFFGGDEGGCGVGEGEEFF